jgi:hypothetical protein
MALLIDAAQQDAIMALLTDAAQEEAILDGIMAALRGEKGSWHISIDYAANHSQGWMFYVQLGRCSGDLRLSVKMSTAELIIWRKDYWYRGDEWKIPPIKPGRSAGRSGCYRLAVLGKLDLSNPKSLTRKNLRDAIALARAKNEPLELMT